MRRFLMTIALTCLLSVSTVAGDIPNVDSHAPAPGGTGQGNSSVLLSAIPSAQGDMSTVDAVQPTLEAALSALLSVLGLVL